MCVMSVLLSCLVGFTIVDSIDLGDHTNGIGFGSGYVWACENAYDSIYKINPDDMQIISKFYYYGNLDGLTYDGEYLWIGYFPASIHKIDTTGNLIDSWPSPGADYSYGMAYDGQYIWHSDKDRRTIYKLDYNNPTTIIDSFVVAWEPRDLCWYRDHLWAVADWTHVYELDPTNMNIINSWPTDRYYSSGLAIGGGYLWFGTSGDLGWLYKVDGVVGVEEASTPLTEPRVEILKVYPNPFRSTVSFSLSVPEPTKVDVRIFDPSGRLITNLFSGVPSTSMLSLHCNGKDNAGTLVTSGVYFVRAETKDRVVYKKIISLGGK